MLLRGRERVVVGRHHLGHLLRRQAAARLRDEHEEQQPDGRAHAARHRRGDVGAHLRPWVELGLGLGLVLGLGLGLGQGLGLGLGLG